MSIDSCVMHALHQQAPDLRCSRFLLGPPAADVADMQAADSVQDGDAVALFNFRSDRMVQISKAFEYEDFNAFDRKRFPKVTACCLPMILILILTEQ